jgi:hypothetical protein
MGRIAKVGVISRAAGNLPKFQLDYEDLSVSLPDYRQSRSNYGNPDFCISPLVDYYEEISVSTGNPALTTVTPTSAYRP